MRSIDSFSKRNNWVITLLVVLLTLLSLGTKPCDGDVHGRIVAAKNYDISVKMPASWTLMYPRADRSILFLVNKPGGVRYGTVAFEISVDLTGAPTEIKQTFPELKEMERSVLEVAQQKVTVTTYAYHAQSLTGDYDGRVFQALLPRGKIYYQVLSYGEANAFKECEAQTMEMLRSIQFSNPEWKPSESQLVYLKGVDSVNSRGNYSSAMEYFQKAVELNPNHVKARLRLGLAYEQSKKFDEAFAQYKAASKISPADPDAWLGMGTVMAWKKDKKKALEYYLKAVHEAPFDYLSYAKAATYLAYENRIKEALAAAQKSQELNHDQGPALDHFIKTLEYALKRLEQDRGNGAKQKP